MSYLSKLATEAVFNAPTVQAGLNAIFWRPPKPPAPPKPATPSSQDARGSKAVHVPIKTTVYFPSDYHRLLPEAQRKANLKARSKSVEADLPYTHGTTAQIQPNERSGEGARLVFGREHVKRLARELVGRSDSPEAEALVRLILAVDPGRPMGRHYLSQQTGKHFVNPTHARARRVLAWLQRAKTAKNSEMAAIFRNFAHNELVGLIMSADEFYWRRNISATLRHKHLTGDPVYREYSWLMDTLAPTLSHRFSRFRAYHNRQQQAVKQNPHYWYTKWVNR